MKPQRSFWLTAVLVPLATGWFFHRHGKPLAASIAVTCGLVLIALRFFAPSVYDRTIRWLELVGRWISSVIGWLVLAAIYLAIFTPVGFVNRIVRRDPLRIHVRNRQSYWLRINNPGSRKSLRHSFLLESTGSQSSPWGKVFRIAFKIGVTVVVLAIADAGLGNFIHRLVRGSISDLLAAPEVVPVKLETPAWDNKFEAEFIASSFVDLKPYIGWRRRDFKGQYINITDGIRTTYQAPSDVSHPKRLFMFGGSTMWGNGVRDGHTLPSEIARLFEQDNVPCVVTNFGEGGGFPGRAH